MQADSLVRRFIVSKGGNAKTKLGRPRRPWLQLPAWSEWTRPNGGHTDGAPVTTYLNHFALFLGRFSTSVCGRKETLRLLPAFITDGSQAMEASLSGWAFFA